MITGAQALTEALRTEGVMLLFGYPGAAICPFYDALDEAAGPRHILVRQEQNAGHAASGYARISGKPGVCVATSGPGATNLITAIATAYMDSIPLVVITGQVQSELLGRDAFQEADITGATVSFTKHRYLVKNARELPRVCREAFYIASTGRPGPVLIDVPVDVQRQELDFSYPAEVRIRSYNPNTRGHAIQIRRAAQALREAKRPLLCAGGGVFGAGAQEELLRLAERAQLPVITTMMGLSAFPCRHPLAMGMLGLFGSACANRALQEADLLIVAGARVGDRAMSSPELVAREKTIIHIDIDPAEIGKNMGTTIPIVGDLRSVLREILETFEGSEHNDWLSALNLWRSTESARRPEAFGDALDPTFFLRVLSQKMRPDGILVADVGQNQIWAASAFDLPQGRFLTSGGMGTMGYSLPAAIGAKLAAPGRQVVAVCGDGSFQMQLMELATLRQEELAIKLLVIKNQTLGMIREIQDQQYGGRRRAIGLGGLPDLEKIAAAYGIPYGLVSCREQTAPALESFLGSPGPYLLECRVSPEFSCLPAKPERRDAR